MEKSIGYLVLSTGDVLQGQWLGKARTGEGELVFNTAMTGYQEVMTDPSYAGQVVTMTYPLIGNYGFNELDHESIKPSLAGLIVSHACESPEHFQATFTLEDMVNANGIPALSEVDTRELTRIIRKHGEVYGRITSDPAEAPTNLTVDPELVKKVSVKEIQTVEAHEADAPHVVVYDFGYKHSISRSLVELGCRVTVVPYDTPADTVEAMNPDGIVLSNGPGDPVHLTELAGTVKAVTDSFPTLGICLGHQLVAMAYGAKTERLPYGHRGSNHPVKHTETGKVFITSQNHGYVVDMQSVNEADWAVSYINVNDRSVEGLMHRSKPIMTVQFHPEAHPGPIDTYPVFQDFLNSITAKGEKQYA